MNTYYNSPLFNVQNYYNKKYNDNNSDISNTSNYSTQDNKEFLNLCNRIENYFPTDNPGELTNSASISTDTVNTANKISTNIQDLVKQLTIERKEYQKKLDDTPIVLEFGIYKCSIAHNNIEYFYYDKHERIKKELQPAGQYVTGYRANGGRGNLELISQYHNVPFYFVGSYSSLNDINVKDLQNGSLVYIRDINRVYTKVKNSDNELTEISGEVDMKSSLFSERCTEKTELKYRDVKEFYYQWDKKNYKEWIKL